MKGQRKIQILAGLSGVGKTQLAFEYGRIFEKETKKQVFIVNAGSKEHYEESIDNLYKKLELQGNTSQKAKIKAICNKLLEQESMLIIDDAPNRERIDSFFLNNSSSGSESLLVFSSKKLNILVTSQNQNWIGAKVSVIEGYSELEAISYIKKVVKNASDGDCGRLAKTLYYHPLALSHAAHYIKINSAKISVGDYIKAFNKQIVVRSESLNQGSLPSDKDRYEKTVLSTFLLSFNQIKSTNTKAIATLEQSIFYDKYHLDIEFISGVKGEEELQIRKILTDYSLISLQYFKRFKIHDLLRDVILIKLTNEDLILKTIKVVTDRLNDQLKYDISSSNDKNRILTRPHFVRIIEINNQYGLLNSNLQKEITAKYINASLYAKNNQNIIDLDKSFKSLQEKRLLNISIAQTYSDKLINYFDRLQEDIQKYEEAPKEFSDYNDAYKKFKEGSLNKSVADKYYAQYKQNEENKEKLKQATEIIITVNKFVQTLDKLSKEDREKLSDAVSKVSSYKTGTKGGLKKTSEEKLKNPQQNCLTFLANKKNRQQLQHPCLKKFM